MSVALITGAGKRLGRSIALALAADGYRIAGHFHSSRDEAESLVGEIEADGGSAAIFQADLSDRAAVGRLFDEVQAEMGAPSVLVNSASTFVNDDIVDFNPAHLDANLAVNLTAPLILSSRFAAACEAGANNVIVNLLDNKLKRLNPDFFSYTTSKYAFLGATEMMSMRLAPDVRVNGIAPSVTLISGKQTQENFERSQALTMLRRGPNAEDIVRAVRYLVEAMSV